MTVRDGLPGSGGTDDTPGQPFHAAGIDRLPGGWIGYAERTTDVGSISSAKPMGLSVAVTVPAGRRLRISTRCSFNSTVANDDMRVYIREDGTTVNYGDITCGRTSGDHYTIGFDVVRTPGAGTVTYDIYATRSGGTGVGALRAGSDYPSFILVEDIGPAT